MEGIIYLAKEKDKKNIFVKNEYVVLQTVQLVNTPFDMSCIKSKKCMNVKGDVYFFADKGVDSKNHFDCYLDSTQFAQFWKCLRKLNDVEKFVFLEKVLNFTESI